MSGDIERLRAEALVELQRDSEPDVFQGLREHLERKAGWAVSEVADLLGAITRIVRTQGGDDNSHHRYLLLELAAMAIRMAEAIDEGPAPVVPKAGRWVKAAGHGWVLLVDNDPVVELQTFEDGWKARTVGKWGRASGLRGNWANCMAYVQGLGERKGVLVPPMASHVKHCDDIHAEPVCGAADCWRKLQPASKLTGRTPEQLAADIGEAPRQLASGEVANLIPEGWEEMNSGGYRRWDGAELWQMVDNAANRAGGVVGFWHCHHSGGASTSTHKGPADAIEELDRPAEPVQLLEVAVEDNWAQRLGPEVEHELLDSGDPK